MSLEDFSFDPLLHHSDIVQITGDLYRLKETR